MKTKTRKAYLARYERDEAGWWVATIKGMPAQSQGRTIEQARERVREALAVLLDIDPSRLTISDDIRLPPTERRALELAKKATRRAAGETERAERATREAARTLLAAGMSLRDAGTLLGVTRQRVHQILEPKPRRRTG